MEEEAYERELDLADRHITHDYYSLLLSCSVFDEDYNSTRIVEDYESVLDHIVLSNHTCTLLS